jgi:hypothetical protein
MRGERAIDRAAGRISSAIDDMIAALPEDMAPHIAMARLVGKLAKLQRQQVQWITEDEIVRDVYEASLAEIPATKGATLY